MSLKASRPFSYLFDRVQVYMWGRLLLVVLFACRRRGTWGRGKNISGLCIGHCVVSSVRRLLYTLAVMYRSLYIGCRRGGKHYTRCVYIRLNHFGVLWSMCCTRSSSKHMYIYMVVYTYSLMVQEKLVYTHSPLDTSSPIGYFESLDFDSQAA